MYNSKPDKWKAFYTALAGAGAVGGAYLLYTSFKNSGNNNSNEIESAPKLLNAGRPTKTLPVRTSNTSSIKPALNFDAQNLAEQLYKFGKLQNVEGVISILQQIRSVDEYSQVSEAYKTITDRNTLVKQTIVTGLLDRVFSNNQAAKERIKSEFIRIGLKTNAISGKWSLSGFKIHKDLITITTTIVRDWMGNKITVRGGTILGDEKDNRNGTTTFIGLDNKVYNVASKDVKYLSAQY